MAPFDIKELRDLTAYDELELDTLGEKKTALFVIISDTDATFNFIVSIMYSQLFNLLCDKADDVYNGRLPIQLKKTHCELAEKHPFFETLQSCVRSTATLSHRFKSSPAIPGNLVVFNATGYMMMAGHFSENYVSSGDLNRPRSPEVRKPLGYSPFFSYKRKE